MGDKGPGRHPRVSDEEILEVIRNTEGPGLTTPDVAAELPIGGRQTLNRLKQLREKGLVKSKQVGPRGQIWYIENE